MKFPDSASAEIWFESMLHTRGFQRVHKETIKEYVKSGKWAYPKLYHCDTSEAYLVMFWREKNAQIKDSSNVSSVGKELDERLKFAMYTFGGDVRQMTQCKEPTLLRLLEMSEHGIETFIVTIYADGDTYWCNARDFYEFATRYGTYQQFSATPDRAQSLPYRVPTGWMKLWTQRDLLFQYPQLGNSSME